MRRAVTGQRVLQTKGAPSLMLRARDVSMGYSQSVDAMASQRGLGGGVGVASGVRGELESRHCKPAKQHPVWFGARASQRLSNHSRRATGAAARTREQTVQSTKQDRADDLASASCLIAASSSMREGQERGRQATANRVRALQAVLFFHLGADVRTRTIREEPRPRHAVRVPKQAKSADRDWAGAPARKQFVGVCLSLWSRTTKDRGARAAQEQWGEMRCDAMPKSRLLWPVRARRGTTTRGKQ